MVTPVAAPAIVDAATLAAGLLSVAAIVALVIILIVRELGSAEAGRPGRRTRLRFLVVSLNAPILALLTVFVVVVIVRMLEVLA